MNRSCISLQGFISSGAHFRAKWVELDVNLKAVTHQAYIREIAATKAGCVVALHWLRQSIACLPFWISIMLITFFIPHSSCSYENICALKCSGNIRTAFCQCRFDFFARIHHFHFYPRARTRSLSWTANQRSLSSTAPTQMAGDSIGQKAPNGVWLMPKVWNTLQKLH